MFENKFVSLPSHLKTIESMEVHRGAGTMCNTKTSKVISSTHRNRPRVHATTSCVKQHSSVVVPISSLSASDCCQRSSVRICFPKPSAMPIIVQDRRRCNVWKRTRPLSVPCVATTRSSFPNYLQYKSRKVGKWTRRMSTQRNQSLCVLFYYTPEPTPCVNIRPRPVHPHHQKAVP